MQFGVPRSEPGSGGAGAMLLVGTVICSSAEAGNNAKALEVRLCIYPLCFYAVVGFSARRSLYSSVRRVGQSITTRSIFSRKPTQTLPAILIEKDS